jgi:hypothetical protein
MRAVSGFCLVLVLILFATSYGFDGKRKGFVLGFGGGFGTLTSPDSDYDRISGLATELLLGHGGSEQLMILYSGQQFWYARSDVFYSYAEPGVVLRYYFSPQSPTFYVDGGPSFAAGVGVADGEGGAFLGGVGGHLSVGYEFAQHWELQGSVAYNFFTVNQGGILNVAVTLQALAF